MSNREAFLQRVRQAVAEGNRATPPSLHFKAEPGVVPRRGRVGYQGAGPDPTSRFCDELRSAGGIPHVVPDAAAARQAITGIVHAKGCRRVVLSRGGIVERLELAGRLRQAGVEVLQSGSDSAEASRDAFFAADLGITNVEYLIAETGTVVMATRPDEPRSLSLLPPVHIAIAECRQLLPDLFDLFDLFSPVAPARKTPSCLTLITGPSKTGDIELRLVTGVHGPGEIQVVLCER